MVQHMYLAVAQARLGSATGATNEWQRALQVANTPEKLLTLATNAEQNSVSDIADAAYSEAIKTAPQNLAAYTGRLRLALTAGRYGQGAKIAAEIRKSGQMTHQPTIKMLYLRLLLGASGDAAETAERDAQVLVGKEPRNWQARATLGLACLRLGRKQEAVVAIREPRVTGVEPPGALAVRAAILAANGYDTAPETTRASSARNRFYPKNALSLLRCCNSGSVRCLSGESVTRCLSKSHSTLHITGSTLQPQRL